MKSFNGMEKIKGFFTKQNIITIGLFILFFLMESKGINNGESQVVLTKAINICLECIGIG